MSNRNKLTSDQLQTHLLDLPEWQGNDQGISRTFGFKTYGDGVAFAIKVTLCWPKKWTTTRTP